MVFYLYAGRLLGGHAVEGADQAARRLDVGRGVEAVDETLDGVVGVDEGHARALVPRHLVEEDGGLLHHDQVLVRDELEQLRNGLQGCLRAVLVVHPVGDRVVAVLVRVHGRRRGRSVRCLRFTN